jgi:hypothetical protein
MQKKRFTLIFGIFLPFALYLIMHIYFQMTYKSILGNKSHFENCKITQVKDGKLYQ